MSKYKVQLRNGFSDRRKIQSLDNEIQIYNFDERTRNKIANLIKRWYGMIYQKGYSSQFLKSLLNDVFGEYVSYDLEDRIKYHDDKIFEEFIYDAIIEEDYASVLTLVEYITVFFNDFKNHYLQINYFPSYCNEFPDFVKELNELFKEEFVGYRMIENQITPISDDIEVEEIKQGLNIQYDGCKSHIKKALTLLSNREKPDYKNSIKESISAVESICKIITKDSKATLGKAINQLEKNGLNIHPSLISAFSKLYGYTSDEGGIRHAEGLFESKVSFGEAKYMLVSCCAFVNYLLEEYSKNDK